MKTNACFALEESRHPVHEVMSGGWQAAGTDDGAFPRSLKVSVLTPDSETGPSKTPLPIEKPFGQSTHQFPVTVTVPFTAQLELGQTWNVRSGAPVAPTAEIRPER